MSDYLVIIPFYNRHHTIKRCLDSLNEAARLTFDLVDVIIVDDGSQEPLVNSFNYDNLLINVIRQKNSSSTQARYNGIRNAHLYIGADPYVVFIDPDDTVKKTCFSDLYRILNTYKADVYLTMLEGYSSGVNIPYIYPSFKSNSKVIGRIYKTDLSDICNIFNPVVGKITRLSNWKKSIENGASMRICLGDDLYMTSLLYRVCKTVVYTDVCYYQYEMDFSGSTTTINKSINTECMHAINVCKFMEVLNE